MQRKKDNDLKPAPTAAYPLPQRPPLGKIGEEMRPGHATDNGSPTGAGISRGLGKYSISPIKIDDSNAPDTPQENTLLVPYLMDQSLFTGGMKSLFSMLLVLLPFFCQAQEIRTFSLKECIDEALKENPQLQASLKRVERAGKAVEQASSLSSPKIGGGYFLSSPETRVGPQRGKIGISQALPWFGMLEEKQQLSGNQATKIHYQHLSTQNLLILQISKIYYPLQALQPEKALWEEHLSLLASLTSLAERKMEISRESLSNILKAKAMLEEANVERSLLNRKERMMKIKLLNLMNGEEYRTLAVPPLPPIPAAGMDTTEYRINNLHPEILAAKAGQEIGLSMAKVAKKEGMPSFSVGLDYLPVSPIPQSMIPENGKDILMPTLQVSIPIFRKQYRAKEAAGLLLKEEEEMREESLRLSLESEGEEALYLAERHFSLAKMHQSQVVEYKRMMALMLSSYRNGSAPLENLLSLQKEVVRHQKEALNNHLQYLLSLSLLQYSRGYPEFHQKQ